MKKIIGMKSMIVMEDYYKQKDNKQFLQILGFGLVKISELNSNGGYDIIFQKGIGIPLIQNVLEMCKEEILEKKQGNSVIPIDEFMIFINFFEENDGNIIILIYMDEKENNVNYAKLYLISKKIINKFHSNKSISEIKNICNNIIEIPRADGLIAILILDSTGSPYYSKFDKKSNISKNHVQISGFISALFSFSQEVIGQESGAKLKEINFGNQRFYMVVKNKVIFAYLVAKVNPLLQRYMYLIVDEFFGKYEEAIEKFTGEVTHFDGFDDKINQYFII